MTLHKGILTKFANKLELADTVHAAIHLSATEVIAPGINYFIDYLY